MSRLVHLRRLAFAALAAAGIAAACRAVAPEAPPMGPRPDPMEPSANPVPGAPDPLDPAAPRGTPRVTPDAPLAPQTPAVSLREQPPVIIQASATRAQAPLDGGLDASDAAVLPPEIPDAVPTDAAKTLQP